MSIVHKASWQAVLLAIAAFFTKGYATGESSAVNASISISTCSAHGHYPTAYCNLIDRPCLGEAGWECNWATSQCAYGPAMHSATTSQLPLNHKPGCKNLANGDRTNYMQNLAFSPSGTGAPCNLDGIKGMLRDARKYGVKVKAVGGCASMSRVGTTDGWLMETYKLTSAWEEPKRINNTRVFWLETGVTISQAVEFFRLHGLAMPNLGGWTGQTLVGAVSTGTHGSGKDFPPLSDFVRAIHYVMGDGKEYIFEPSTGGRFRSSDFGPEITLVQDDDQFYSSVVTAGSLGVVYRILYEPIPYYYLHQNRWMTSWGALQGEEIDKLLEEHDHIEVWVNPYTNQALVTARTRYAGDYEHERDAYENAAREARDANLHYLDLNSYRKMREMTHAAWGMRATGDLWDAMVDTAQMAISGWNNMVGNTTGTLVSALENQAALTNIFMPYVFVYDAEVANYFNVLTSEVSAPLERMDQLAELMHQYATKRAVERGQWFTSIYSFRFTKRSQHKLALSYGTDVTVSMEVITFNDRFWNPSQEGYSKEEDLMAGWVDTVLNKVSDAKMHWGLQSFGRMDATYLHERFPEGSRILQEMRGRYDPDGVVAEALVPQGHALLDTLAPNAALRKEGARHHNLRGEQALHRVTQ